ncbi:MAG TPA: HAD family hydrolase [Candidatus Woesebacteria bacterium]|nr:HAD family hydrolase [Clostridiales bacterium]HRR05564.1 HAD family hydrolase [Candidatus Woesebacteria bacterium]
MAIYSHIFWDWNGTLLDDVNTALQSVNQMLKLRGMQAIDLDIYYEYIGTPIRGFYEKLFDLEKENYDNILAEYHSLYAKLLPQTKLAQGGLEVLEKAKALGVKQTLLSSSEQNQLDAQVKHFGIYDYFEDVLGAENFLAGGKTMRAKAHIEKNKIDSKSLLVVGDLVQDCEMAKAVGADCILLAAGHQGLKQLEKAGAPIIRQIDEVIKRLA